MSISNEKLQQRKADLAKDFATLKGRIDTAEKEILTMRNNLNAVAGAIQQCDLFIKDLEAGNLVAENEQDNEKLKSMSKKATMPAEKQAALNMAIK
tara:strand:+ start:3966 stop:4253 length:288 start_codon:yes stop_codon:yes gene_type:complete